MRSLKCSKNAKAKNTDDCYDCFLRNKYELSRVLCKRSYAKYTDEDPAIPPVVEAIEPVIKKRKRK